MADYFYTVDVSRDEESARSPGNVDKFFVQLICDGHLNVHLSEADRESSACEVAIHAAKRRYGLAGTKNIGYSKASRYEGKIPNLGHARFSATCGCLVWYL